MKSRVLKWSLYSGIALISAVVVLGFVWFRNLRNVHRHCIKVAGSAFRDYAEAHGGTLPFHTNGFGDAMLLLVKEQQLPGVAWICGPGDDGTVLSNALVHGLDVPEAQCSRVYVQGLSETNDPAICILFDRRSVPGGDHFYGSGRPIRELCMLDGIMETVTDEQWPAFCRRQVELLVAAGWTRKQAEEYYPEVVSRK